MTNTTRVDGIDAMRLVAVIGVILIHLHHHGALATLIPTAFRFAVPFFFVASGFFIARSSGTGSIEKVARRVLPPFLIWAAVYAVVLGIEKPLDQSWVRYLIGGGEGYHLWFLSSIFINSVLILLLRDRISPERMLGLSAGVYILGLLFGPYSQLVGIPNTYGVWNWRDGPFFGFFFMTAGFVMAVRARVPRIAAGVLLFVVGGAMQAIEAKVFMPDGFPRDQLLGTMLFGIGAFCIAYNAPDGPILRWMATIGRWSLGVYCIHLLAVELVENMIKIDSYLDSFLAIGLALSLAVGAAFALSYIPKMRFLLR